MSLLSSRQPRRNGCDCLLWTQHGFYSENYLTRWPALRLAFHSVLARFNREIEELSEETAKRLKDGIGHCCVMAQERRTGSH